MSIGIGNRIQKIISRIPFEIFVIAIIILESIFIFQNIYKCLGNCVGETGDTYYNLSILLQRSEEVFSGRIFSLISDHYTWYPNVIGLTSHNTAISIVFGAINYVVNNPVLSYNLIFFGNIILTQLGVYLLSNYYSKNKWLSLFLSLLIPLSSATNWNFYTGHIHAALFGALPFWIYFSEKYFAISKNNKKRLLYLFLIIITSLWLFWAEWHVMIFSLFAMGIWSLYKVFTKYKFDKKSSQKFLVFGIANLIPLVSIVPLGLQYLRLSEQYSAIRTINDVAVTNWNTESYYFFNHILAALLRIYQFIFDVNQDEKIEKLLSIKSTFPDIFSSVIFFAGLGVLIWIIYKLIRKEKFNKKFIPHLISFLLLYIIALGPFLKIDGKIYDQFKMPHYYLYQIIFPLSAIRAIWRSTAVGFISMCIFISSFSINLKYLYERFVNKLFVKVLIFIIAIGVLCITWENKLGTAYLVVEEDSNLIEIANDFDESTIDFYVWRKNYHNPDYNYRTSLYNYKSKETNLRWVAGGTIGYPQTETDVLSNYMKEEKFSGEIAELLFMKNVDLIVFDETDYNSDYVKNVKENLRMYYSLRLEDKTQNKSYWVLNENNKLAKQNPSFSLMMSSTQKENSNIYLYLNEFNESDDLVSSDNYFIDIEVKIFDKFNGLVSTENFKRVERPFLFSGWGNSYLFELENNLQPGDYTLLVNVSDKELAKEFLVLNKSEYDSLVDRSEIVFKDYALWNNSFSYDRSFIPVRLKGVIESGMITEDTDIAASFLNDNDEMYNSYYEYFSIWWGQPICSLKGIYFPNDEIDFWCRQFTPADSSFNFSTIGYEE